MATYVPGVGTFTPDLPEWLVLHTDGRLYNVNAAANRLRLTEPWTPPEGWRGDGDLRFEPEGEPVTPPPPPPPPVDERAALVQRWMAAMRAMVAHDRQLLDLARSRVAEDSARMEEGLRLADEANKAFDAVLADLQKNVNPQ